MQLNVLLRQMPVSRWGVCAMVKNVIFQVMIKSLKRAAGMSRNTLHLIGWIQRLSKAAYLCVRALLENGSKIRE